jgi:hypothetical protein
VILYLTLDKKSSWQADTNPTKTFCTSMLSDIGYFFLLYQYKNLNFPFVLKRLKQLKNYCVIPKAQNTLLLKKDVFSPRIKYLISEKKVFIDSWKSS